MRYEQLRLFEQDDPRLCPFCGGQARHDPTDHVFWKCLNPDCLTNQPIDESEKYEPSIEDEL